MSLQFSASVIIVAWIGIAMLASLFGAALYATNLLGRHLFRRLRRVYHLTVLGYWLDRMERDGIRTFEKADDK